MAQNRPLQAQRYLERGAHYVGASRCVAFHAVIVAPQRYFGSASEHKGVHSRLTYEQLASWFEAATDLGARRHYKVALLRSAIEKGTLGYQPEEDGPTTSFWQSYWQMALARAPELEMAEPESKPSGSTFVSFRPPKLPRGVDIVHKLTFGYVDLQLRGFGDRLNEVRAAFAGSLEADMVVASAAKSAAIRLAVPKLTADKPWASQSAEVAAGIDAAKRLLAWIVANETQRQRLVGPAQG